MDDSDDTNYDVSKLAWQIFHYTGSNELPCLDEPVITPGDQAVFSKEFIVKIDHDQWKEDLSIKPKIYYRIEERNDDGGTIIKKDWTEAPKLPLTLTLTKSSTVKAHAEFGSATKDVSRTYILLDESTTYVNKEERLDVGTTVEMNGMTMTYGGIQKEDSYFTKFSNIDNSLDNILGSLHAVTGTPLYSSLDAMSEKGVVSEKSSLYSHKQASDQALHERTFSLPAIGSFFKFEPEANGKLTVFVEQQGAMLKSKGKLDPAKVRKRIVYFLDETGTSIPATYAYTSSKVNKSDWKSVQNTPVEGNDAYMTKLKEFYHGIIDGKNKTFPNINSAYDENSREQGLVLGESIQPIIVLHDERNKDILEEDATYDQTGYMLISEGYVTYTFPVKAGKTYYLFASGTKLALSGFSFKQDASYSATNITLNGDANNETTINNLIKDNQYNVTLNRSFGKDKWYAVVLPFSVSQKQMKSVFGDGVSVLHYNNVTGTTLNLTEHFYKMVVGGTPVFVKPSKDVTNPKFDNVTLTSNKVVDIEDSDSNFKCTGSWDDVDFPKYSYFINAKDSKFYLFDPTKVAAGTKPHAGAFRAWIISTSPNLAAASQLNMHINGVEDNDETTAIWNAISADDDNAEVGSKDIYSLSGQKMNTTDTHSLPKGIYIVNGKKFIIK